MYILAFVQFQTTKQRLHFTFWIRLGYQAGWYVLWLLYPQFVVNFLFCKFFCQRFDG